jgi:hypothetical protein
MKTAFIILGMHRSGTSALTKIINILGASIGDSLVPGRYDNVKGFFEHADIMNIHEELLSSLNSSWDFIGALPDNWWEQKNTSFYKERLKGILCRDFGEQQTWALKDPRQCRLLPLWLPLFHELGITPHFIIVLRNPQEVAASLAVRDGFSYNKSFLIWMRHVLEAEFYSRSYKRIFIKFSDLMQDQTAAINCLAKFMDVVTTDNQLTEIKEFIDQSLKHHHTDDHGLLNYPTIPHWLKDTYATCLTLLENSIQTHAYFDDMRQKLHFADSIWQDNYLSMRDHLSKMTEKYENLQSVIQNKHSELQNLVIEQSKYSELQSQMQNQLIIEQNKYSELQSQMQNQLVIEQNSVKLQEEMKLRLDCLEDKLVKNETFIKMILQSKSWKVTQPLRNIVRFFRASIRYFIPV